jgi:hypothetical protein
MGQGGVWDGVEHGLGGGLRERRCRGDGGVCKALTVGSLPCSLTGALQSPPCGVQLQLYSMSPIQASSTQSAQPLDPSNGNTHPAR